MTIREEMKKKEMTVYRLAKMSGVPYSTVSDICSGKAELGKCSAETVYRLAGVLGVSVEDLLNPYMMYRPSFENYKSHVCQQLKANGDIDFIIHTLEGTEIEVNFQRRWYPECFYLLAMVDYISRINGIPLCDKYDDLRKMKLKEPLFPAGICAMDYASGTDEAKEKALQEAIPEFKRFNLIENEVRSVA